MVKRTLEEANALFQRQVAQARGFVNTPTNIVDVREEPPSYSTTISPNQVVYAYTGGSQPPRPVVLHHIFFGSVDELPSVERWYVAVTFVGDQTLGNLPLVGTVFSEVKR